MYRTRTGEPLKGWTRTIRVGDPGGTTGDGFNVQTSIKPYPHAFTLSKCSQYMYIYICTLFVSYNGFSAIG